MNPETALFHFERENITSHIVARFEHEVLVIDGNDVGKTVTDYLRDLDDEYSMRIPYDGIEKPSGHFGNTSGGKGVLIDKIAANFNTNTCYSELEELISQLNVQHGSFKWK